MTVRAERDGRVTTVVLDRPAARNAVDGPAAAALAQAFREFDAGTRADVAVLWGAGGTFCAGADLKTLGGQDGNRARPDGDGPMGPTRLRRWPASSVTAGRSSPGRTWRPGCSGSATSPAGAALWGDSHPYRVAAGVAGYRWAVTPR